jgi:hypothetical protein
MRNAVGAAIGGEIGQENVMAIQGVQLTEVCGSVPLCSRGIEKR